MNHRWLPVGFFVLCQAAGRLFAQAERTTSPVWDMGRNFREAGDNFQWIDVAVVVAIVAVIGVVLALLVYYTSQREKRGYRRPGNLFHELCRGHELDRRSRRLLKQLARQQKLAQPALLFVSPERWSETAIAGSNIAQRVQLMRLRDRLFATSTS
jgi:hypothetical protein